MEKAEQNSQGVATERAAETAYLVAGSKLDMVIAERVMGWERGPRWGNGNGGWTIDGKPYDEHGVSWDHTPKFSTSIAAAMEVLSHLRPQYEESFVGFYQLRDRDTGELVQEWEASCVFERGIEIPNARVLVTDPATALNAMALAICRAALEAVSK